MNNELKCLICDGANLTHTKTNEFGSTQILNYICDNCQAWVSTDVTDSVRKSLFAMRIIIGERNDEYVFRCSTLGSSGFVTSSIIKNDENDFKRDNYLYKGERISEEQAMKVIKFKAFT